MADLQYSVGIDSAQGVRALSAFDNALGKLDGNLRGIGSGGNLGKLGGTLAGLGGAAGFGALIARGFRFNQTLGDSQSAIAQVLAQFQGLNAEAAKNAAAEAMQKIVQLEPQTAGTLADLTGGFLATLAASQSAGISVEDNIDLVGKFANALANANIPADQLAQEMRSILTGNIGADSTLAQVLGLTNDDVKRAAAAGNLAQFLSDRLGKLGTAGDTAGVAFSTLSSAVDKVAGALAQGLFDDAVAGAKALAVELEANRDLFVGLGQGIATASGALLGLARGVKNVSDALGITGAAIALTFGQGMNPVDAFNLALDAAAANMADVGKSATTTGTAITTGLAPAISAADKLAAAIKAVDGASKGAQTQPAAPGGGGGGEAEPPEGGRKKIMGYSAERQGGRDAARGRAADRMAAARARIDANRAKNFGGINEFNALQVEGIGDDEGNRAFSAFGGEKGRLSAAEAGRRVGAFREPGTRSPGDSAAFRNLQESLGPNSRSGGGGASATDQTSAEMLTRLDEILAELQKFNQ